MNELIIDWVVRSTSYLIELNKDQDILLNQYIGNIGAEHFRGNGPIIQIDALGDNTLKSKLTRNLKGVPNVNIYYGDEKLCSIDEHNHHKDYYSLLDF